MKSVAAPLILFAFAALSPSAEAQVLNAEEQKVWKDFMEAKELNDARAMEKIAQREKEHMARIFDEFDWCLTENDSVSLWEDLKLVGRAIDNAESSNSYAAKVRIIEKMDLASRQKRGEYRNEYAAARGRLQAARKKKDREAIKDGVEEMQTIAGKFAEINEPLYQAYCLGEVAFTLVEENQQVDAVRLYNDIDALLVGAGFEQFRFLGDVRRSREDLLAQGYDPDAKPGEQQGPSGNTGTSWSDDPAGKRYSDPIPLKLVVEPKITSKFKTANGASTDNSFRWPKFSIRGEAQVQFEDSFKPFGESFKVRRDGVKVIVDDGVNKEFEIKAIQKPSLVEMEREVKDIDGNTHELEYAWLSGTGGEENIFGMQVNSSPSQDNLNLRYRSACYLKGKVLGLDVIFLDDNSSGRFGDPVKVRDGISLAGPEYMYNDAMMVGRAKVAGPYSEYLQVDGDFYRMKLDPTTYSVRTRKLSVDTGTVKYKFKGKVKPSVLVIEEIREFKGAFFAIDQKSPTVVPVGTYRISHGIIRSGKGKQEKTCEIFPGESVAFQVKKDEEHVLELGAPFTFDFETERTPDGNIKVIGRSVMVRGSADELYIRFFDEPPIPDKVAARPKGSSGGGRSEKMEKATFDDYRNDQLSAWGPLDLILDGKSGTDYEVQMQLKKHPLLGGPIKSDWK